MTYFNNSNKSIYIDKQEESLFFELCKKAERISAAVFLVSNTMSDNDESKTLIRKLGTDFIFKCIKLNDVSPGERAKEISSIETIVLQLVSFFEIFSTAGIVSKMNASILIQELKKFIDVLKAYFSAFDGSIPGFMGNYFGIGQNVEAGAEPGKAESRKKYAGNGRAGLESPGAEKMAGTTRKDTRSRAILDFIGSKESVNIKDISRNVKGCSEKTIQRELLRMISEGSVKRTGERRWSRYVLA